MLKKVNCRATFIVLCTMLSVGAYAAADVPKRVDIPAGELSGALLMLSKQYGVELVYRPEQVYGLKTRGAHGVFTSEQAVMHLLEGAPLELRADPSGAMLIAPLLSGGAQPADDAAPVPGAQPRDTSDGSKEGKNNSSAEFRVAQMAEGTNSPGSTLRANAAFTQDANKTSLTEIVVTAEKREGKLLDVPVPVSVTSAEALLSSNQLRIQDYYATIPSLSLSTGNRGEPQLTIRGIISGPAANPTVGIVVDDVPFGSSTSLGGGFTAPDIDPSDLASIEVLRGPQGTLYGASSMGGLIKFVTLDPSTNEFSGRVQAGTSGVYNGAELGYSARGSVNIPLTDTMAVRASGFTRQDPGYIDNVQTGQRGVNKGKTDGGRLSMLWRASEDVSLKLGAMIQDSSLDGSPYVNAQPGLGELQQSAVRGTGFFDRQTQVYSATVSAKLGGVHLTSISGYNRDEFSDNIDFSSPLGAATEGQFGVAGATIPEHTTTEKFSQELRLSGGDEANFEWLVGGFYTHEKSPHFEQDILAANPVSGAVAGIWELYYWGMDYEEYAGFADLTYHFTDRFDVQFGGRKSEDKQATSSTDSHDLFLPDPTVVIVTPTLRINGNAFTYLVTPRFRITPDFMVYARLASGYRAGGPNPNFTVAPGLPEKYEPDKTQNYEIGIKGDALNHTLSFDASLYYINWKDIQLSLIQSSTGYNYNINGGSAKSQGVELSVASKPMTGLTLSAWVVWNDAVLTQDFPPASQGGTAYGMSGDRLPYSSRFSSNISAKQEFPLGSRVTGFTAGALSYVGDRIGNFGATSQRQDLPGYAQIDVRGGINWDTWTFSIFGTNVADRRGVLAGGLGYINQSAFQYIQPRTIGLSVSKTF